MAGTGAKRSTQRRERAEGRPRDERWAVARFGRRHAPRVGPDEGEVIACALRTPRGQACPGEVRDLSALGVGVYVEAAEAAVLEHAVRVRILLSFARPADSLQLEATIRRRSPQGDRLLLACELVEEGSGAASERLAAWVEARLSA